VRPGAHSRHAKQSEHAGHAKPTQSTHGHSAHVKAEKSGGNRVKQGPVGVKKVVSAEGGVV